LAGNLEAIMEINMILSIPSTISNTVNVINDTQISGFANHSIFFLLSSNVNQKLLEIKQKNLPVNKER
jgi:hypothetical protein